jgi:hypothetical protein
MAASGENRRAAPTSPGVPRNAMKRQHGAGDGGENDRRQKKIWRENEEKPRQASALENNKTRKMKISKKNRSLAENMAAVARSASGGISIRHRKNLENKYRIGGMARRSGGRENEKQSGKAAE